ncbi:MAG: GerMN domain-containing protein [Clostridiales bacterium]|nr:GerMN domain-containing protein [Clostridiales bacterium]
MASKRITKRNGTLFIGIGLAAIAAAVFVAALADRGDEPTVRLYFYNPASAAVEPEERPITPSDEASMTQSVLNMFLEGSKNQLIPKPLPENVKILGDSKLITDPFTNETSFQVEFSEEYNAMPHLEEAFFRTSFVWTMTDLKFIKSVNIYVGGKKLVSSRGEPLEFLNRQSVDINPEVSAIISKEVILYFATESGDQLVFERRNIEINPDLHVEPFIVEQIIKGPNVPGHYPTISSDVKVREVKTEEGICYVNLSADFLVKSPNSSASEEVMIYSIVNSLLEVSGVKKVKFLVESENISQFRTSVDLSKQFERDDSIIMQLYD